jgi:hypothetical protein
MCEDCASARGDYRSCAILVAGEVLAVEADKGGQPARAWPPEYLARAAGLGERGSEEDACVNEDAGHASGSLNP